MTKKIGKVLMPRAINEDLKKMQAELYGEMRVIEERTVVSCGHECIEVLCECDKFDEIAEGDDVPCYSFIVTKEQYEVKGGVNVSYSIKFKRLD